MRRGNMMAIPKQAPAQYMNEILRGIEDTDAKWLSVGDTKLHGRLKDGFRLMQDDEDLSDIRISPAYYMAYSRMARQWVMQYRDRRGY